MTDFTKFELKAIRFRGESEKCRGIAISLECSGGVLGVTPK